LESKLDTQFSESNKKYLLDCADLFLRFNQFKKAREIYGQILKIDIRHLSALKGLGICLYREKNWDAARKCFKAYAELSGELDGKVWLNSCFLLNGETEKAKVFFQTNLESQFTTNPQLTPLTEVPSDVLDSLKILLEKPTQL
jgi:tetratricopeptide (TPR) repeat protein